MVAVKVFIEGGGTTRAQQAELRRGFARLFARVLGNAPKPRAIPSGGRKQALDDFATALRVNDGARCLLLADSEAPVRKGASPWDHVRERPGDGWEKPAGAEDDQLHLMVQAMEAWFTADPDALAAFYGQGFEGTRCPVRRTLKKSPRPTSSPRSIAPRGT